MNKNKDDLLKKLEIMELERKSNSLSLQLDEINETLSNEAKLREQAIVLIASKTKEEMIELLIRANHNNALGVSNEKIIEICNNAHKSLVEHSNGTMRIDVALENTKALLEIIEHQLKQLNE